MKNICFRIWSFFAARPILEALESSTGSGVVSPTQVSLKPTYSCQKLNPINGYPILIVRTRRLSLVAMDVLY